MLALTSSVLRSGKVVGGSFVEGMGIFILVGFLVSFFPFDCIIYIYIKHIVQTWVKKLSKGSRPTHDSSALIFGAQANNQLSLPFHIIVSCRFGFIFQRKSSWVIVKYGYFLVSDPIKQPNPLIIFQLPSVDFYPYSPGNHYL